MRDLIYFIWDILLMFWYMPKEWFLFFLAVAIVTFMIANKLLQIRRRKQFNKQLKRIDPNGRLQDAVKKLTRT